MQVLNFVSHAYFYFIWFFAQFPDLFIWLYPFSLIQSNPLKVWFDCFRLFLGQIYKSFNWFYEFFYISQTCKFVLFDFKPLQIAKVGFGVLDILVKTAFLAWNRRDLKICVSLSKHWFPGFDRLGQMSNLPHFSALVCRGLKICVSLHQTLISRSRPSKT